MFVRLACVVAAGIAVVGLVVLGLALLLSHEPNERQPEGVDHSKLFAQWVEKRYSPRADFEVVDRGVIVPVGKAPELLRPCSRPGVDPIQGYWRPTPDMVRELQRGLPAFLRDARDFYPLENYIAQYAGVVSAGRDLIYGSYTFSPANERWKREVMRLCGGGHHAFGLVFDIQSKAFGELQVNGPL